ncbi:M20 family metallopeptidase [Pseudonocardia nematodicida]
MTPRRTRPENDQGDIISARHTAIDAAYAYVDSGRLLDDVTAAVRYRTVSVHPAEAGEIRRYLDDHLVPRLERLGFRTRVEPNPVSPEHPFLLAVREEEHAAFTALTYGHADVQPPQEGQWREGLDPWELVVDGDHWYGRGTADNKGQHTINLAALEQVIAQRGGTLGYTVKAVFETGEEAGSPGMMEFCRHHAAELSADVFLASDGPRLSTGTPTLWLGNRGMFMFRLEASLRERSYHSGNWGGVLANAGTVLAGAIAALVDARGRLLVDALTPRDGIPDSVRELVRDLPIGGGDDDPVLSEDWGEPGLSPGERLFAWNTLEVLDVVTGQPERTVGAIPGYARATLQLRFVVGTDEDRLVEGVRAHLDRSGFGNVTVAQVGPVMSATRLDPGDPWAQLAARSVRRTTGQDVTILPSVGASIQNRAFADVLGLPTIWIPHSYPACAQHAPNEHLLASLSREAIGIMAGLFWDLGDVQTDNPVRRNS